MLEQTHDEAQIARLATLGDADAFGVLYGKYHKAIYHYILARVRNERDAEDLTSLVFLKAWEVMPRYQERVMRFGSWLFRIAHNTVIDHYRAHKHTRSHSFPDSEFGIPDRQTVADEVIAAEEREHLSQALEALPQDQREVIKLRYFEGLNHTEVAQRVNKTLGACRVIQHRALKNLNVMLRSMVVVVLIVLLGAANVMQAAFGSVPYEPLYPVKRVFEQAQVRLAISERDRIRLYNELASHRLDEIDKLIARSQSDRIVDPLREYSQYMHLMIAAFESPSIADQAAIDAMKSAIVATQHTREQQLASIRSAAPVNLQSLVDDALHASQKLREAIETETPAASAAPVRPATTQPIASATPTGSWLSITSTMTLEPAYPGPRATDVASAPPPSTTPTPLPSATPLPPTSTPDPTPSATPLPPTSTPEPLPSATAAPPSPTPPPPSATPLPSPSATPLPSATSTTPPTSAPKPPPSATPTPTLPSATPTTPPTSAPKPPPSTTPTPTPTSTPDQPQPPDNQEPVLPSEIRNTLTVQEIASEWVVHPGDRLTYKIWFLNASHNEASLRVETQLSELFDYVATAASHGASYNTGSHTLTWDNITVNGRSILTLSFEVTARPVPWPISASNTNAITVVHGPMPDEYMPAIVVIRP